MAYKATIKKCLDCPAQITAGKRCPPCGADRSAMVSKASKKRVRDRTSKRRAHLIGPAIAAAE